MHSVLQGAYLAHTSGLEEPAYFAFAEWTALAGAIYRRFRGHGVSVEDIQFEGGRQPADYEASCSAFRAGFSARFRLMSIETWFSGEAPLRNRDAPASVVADAFMVYKDLSPVLMRSHQGVSISGHARLSEGTYADLLARFVAGDKVGQPPLRPLSLSLVAEVGTGRSAILDIQASQVYKEPDYAFLQVRLDLREELPEREAIEIAWHAAESLLGRLDVQAV